MESKKDILLKTILKDSLVKNYIKFLIESDEDLGTIVDIILEDLSTYKFSEKDEQYILDKLTNEIQENEIEDDLDIKDKFIKEAQRHSETWKNVQKAKEIMKNLKQK